MIKELFGDLGTFGLQQASLIIFLLVFISICIRVFLFSSRKEMNHHANLPNEE